MSAAEVHLKALSCEKTTRLKPVLDQGSCYNGWLDVVEIRSAWTPFPFFAHSSSLEANLLAVHVTVHVQSNGSRPWSGASLAKRGSLIMSMLPVSMPMPPVANGQPPKRKVGQGRSQGTLRNLPEQCLRLHSATSDAIHDNMAPSVIRSMASTSVKKPSRGN